MDWITRSSQPFLYNHSVEVGKAFDKFYQSFHGTFVKTGKSFGMLIKFALISCALILLRNTKMEYGVRMNETKKEVEI